MANYIGTSGNDTLNGSTAADNIFGHEGADKIYGKDGDDRLSGGMGNDYLQGDNGADTYVIARGDGKDTVNNKHSDDAVDTVEFTDIASTEVGKINLVWDGSYTHSGSLVIGLGGTDQLTLAGSVYNDGYSSVGTYSAYSSQAAIAQMLFSDGVVWSWEDLLSQSLRGTTGNDSLKGYQDRNDTFFLTKGGQDTLDDTQATDTVEFVDVASTEVGPIKLVWDGSYTHSGSLVIGLGGTDQLKLVSILHNAGNSSEGAYSAYASQIPLAQMNFSDGVIWSWEDLLSRSLQGTAGNDSLTGYKDRDDILNGAAGNDHLRGDDGADIYLIARGDGKDTINNKHSDDAVDTVEFTDIASTEVGTIKLVWDGSYTYSGSLVIGLGGTNQLTLDSSIHNDGYSSEGAYSAYSSQATIAQMRFSDGVVWSWEDLLSQSLLGTTGNDSLTGYQDRNDTFFLTKGGQDTLDDAQATDTVEFVDVASTEVGPIKLVWDGSYTHSGSLVIGLGGTDQLKLVSSLYNAGNSSEGAYSAYASPIPLAQMNFSDGVIWGWEDLLSRSLQGTAGNDSLTGYKDRDDILNGAAGNDYLQGDNGADTYLIARGDGKDTINNKHSDDAMDTVEFTDIASTEVAAVKLTSSGGLVIGLGGTDQITLAGSISSSGSAYSAYASQASIAQVRFADAVVWSWEDLLSQSLRGTTGNDSLTGYQDRSDTFFLTKGGQDTLDDVQATDTVEFIDVASTDVGPIKLVWDGSYTHSGSLVIGLGGTDQLKLVSSLYNAGNSSEGAYSAYASPIPIAQMSFSDGVIWNWEDLLSRSLQGTAGSDSLTGYKDRDDILNGAAGNDYLQGDNGADTYLIARGDGKDTINNKHSDDAMDTVEFTDIASTEVAAVKLTSSGGLVIGLGGTDQITLAGSISSSGSAYSAYASQASIAQVRFADAVVWSWEDLLSQSLRGTTGNDSLTGYQDRSDAFLLTKGGQDTIDDVEAVDTVEFVDVASTEVGPIKLVWDGSYTHSGSLVIGLGGMDQLTLAGSIYNAGSSSVGTYSAYAAQTAITPVRFADGVVWGKEDLLSRTLQGTTGNDTLTGYTDRDDTLNGAAGNDSLKGSGGNDTFVIDLQDGAAGNTDTILDFRAQGEAVGQEMIRLLDGGLQLTSTQIEDLFALSNQGYSNVTAVGKDTHIRFDNGSTLIIKNSAAWLSPDDFDAALPGADPSNGVPAAQSVPEDTTLVFASAAGNALSVTDPDSTTLSVTLTGTHGTLSLAATTGLTFTAGDGTGDAVMAFSGTAAAINSALDGLRYTPAADHNGAASLQLVTSDGVMSDSDTLAISVTPTDDPPTLADIAFTIDENSAAGTAVGTLVGSDIDSTGLSYRLSSGNTDLDGDGQMAFALDAGGVLTVNDPDDLDYERGAVFTLGVEIGDGTLTGAAAVTVNLRDVLDPAVLPGVTITPLDGAVTSELGSEVHCAVVLNTRPTADVTLTFTSTQPAEGMLPTAALTFNRETWNIPQTLVIRGVDDTPNDVFDPNVSYQVTGVVVSDDIDYIRGIVVPVISLTNSDDPNDAPKALVGDQNAANLRDALRGGNVGDILSGGEDIDYLYGGRGDDRLNGGNDDDRLWGEEGDDRLNGDNGFDTLDGGAGNDIQSGGNDDDTLAGGDGNDQLNGDNGLDRLDGGAGADVLNGGDQNDHLDGGADHDKLYGGGGDDTLAGGEGNDTLDGGTGIDALDGGAGNDVYYIDDIGDVVSDSGPVSDHDLVIIPATLVYRLGNSLEDATLSGSGNGKLTGNLGRNTLTGNAGNNVLDGGADNDTLAGGAGNDTLKGGSGSDTADYSTVTKAITANLATGKVTGNGSDLLSAIEDLLGGKGNDLLTGNADANRLTGGAGKDVLTGAAGSDVITGGGGADRFVYTVAADSGVGAAARDTIADFSSAQGDKLDLRRLDADATQEGVQVWSFVSGGFSGASGQVTFDGANHRVLFDADGDRQTDFEIELIGVSALTASDFLLT